MSGEELTGCPIMWLHGSAPHPPWVSIPVAPHPQPHSVMSGSRLAALTGTSTALPCHSPVLGSVWAFGGGISSLTYLPPVSLAYSMSRSAHFLTFFFKLDCLFYHTNSFIWKVLSIYWVTVLRHVSSHPGFVFSFSEIIFLGVYVSTGILIISFWLLHLLLCPQEVITNQRWPNFSPVLTSGSFHCFALLHLC